MDGIERIAAERRRQVEALGWTLQHDIEEHPAGELALAAVCYAAPIPVYVHAPVALGHVFCDPWPKSWGGQWDKRQEFADTDRPPYSLADPARFTPAQRIDLLTKAGALIAAEIDRLQALEQGAVGA